jgi:hypothetical protein
MIVPTLDRYRCFRRRGPVVGILCGFFNYFCTCCFRAIKIIRFLFGLQLVSLTCLHYVDYVQFSLVIIANDYFWYSSAMVIAVYEFATNERSFMPNRLEQAY